MGEMQSFKRSPNLENVIISINHDEYYEDSSFSRSMLHVLNIDKMAVIIPNSNQDYFTDPWYPIFHYEWIDDTTIQAEVPDVENYESPTLYKWQQSQEKKGKSSKFPYPIKMNSGIDLFINPALYYFISFKIRSSSASHPSKQSS